MGRRGEAAEALAPGSLLLLYTDGLVETRDHDIDQGIDRLCARWARWTPAPGPSRSATP